MGIARRQLGKGIADPDDRSPLEQIAGNALVLHPAAMHEAVLIGAAEPGRGTERGFLGHFLSLDHGKAGPIDRRSSASWHDDNFA
jgi:hypothetical protein